MKKFFIVIIMVIIFIIVIGCSTQISQIKKDPYYYNGREVYISGVIQKYIVLNESQIYNAPVPLYLYILKDNFGETVAFLSIKIYYPGNYKSIQGKVLVFKYNLFENDIQFITKELIDYLSKKEALPSSKKKESQKAFISIIAGIINILTNGKITEQVDTISQGAQTIIDYNTDEIDKQYISEVIQSFLKYLPKDEYYIIILEDYNS